MMRAAIYARQSLDRSGQGVAVARQIRECRALAAEHGWDVAEPYTDNDRSASNRKVSRPDWTRLLADLDSGMFDVLVCWHTDRLYRRVIDLARLVEIAERRSLRIATVRAGDVDLSTPAGRMFAGILASAGRYETEQSSARRTAANTGRAREGKVIWSRRPFGFDRVKYDVTIVESEAAEIRKAVNSVMAGATLSSVAADMNNRGIQTSIGSPWQVTPLRNMLLNPRLCGRLEHRGQQVADDGPQIIDPESFDALGALLRDPRRRLNASPGTVKYLMSGLARCGVCASACFRSTYATHSGPVGYYKCRGPRVCVGRKAETVDELVEAAVIARLSRADAAALLASDVDVLALRARVGELRQRRDGLAVLLADGLMAESAVREQAARLTEQIDKAETEIAVATGASPLAEIVGADDVAATWDGMAIRVKRAVVDTLMTVTIYPRHGGIGYEDVAIEWRA